jgi:hypothetical protein
MTSEWCFERKLLWPNGTTFLEFACNERGNHEHLQVVIADVPCEILTKLLTNMGEEL